MPLTAYIDESIRRRRGEPVCVYVLSAVVVADDQLDGLRDGMRSLLQGKVKTIHWRRERSERLPVIAATIAAMPIASVVTVCLHGESISSERARRISLRHLVRELVIEGVDRAVFESRQDQDRLDYDLLRHWRRFGAPGGSLRVDFVPALEEPALWAPDCVAGAVAWWLNGDAIGWNELEPLIRVVDVDLG